MAIDPLDPTKLYAATRGEGVFALRAKGREKSRGVVQAVSMVSTLVVARLLSSADYGLMALAMIWTGTLALVVELGLGPAIVQFPDLEDAELNMCFWLTMIRAARSRYSRMAVREDGILTPFTDTCTLPFSHSRRIQPRWTPAPTGGVLTSIDEPGDGAPANLKHHSAKE